MKILIFMLLLNSLIGLLSNGATKIKMLRYEKRRTLDEKKEAKASGKLNICTYILPGFAGPEEQAFHEVFAPFLKGEVKYVRYPHANFRPARIVGRIVEDLSQETHDDYDKINFLVFGSGALNVDELRRSTNAEQWGRISLFLINPISGPRDVKKIQSKIYLFGIPAWLIDFCLGLAGNIPLMKIDGVWRSPSELISQLLAMIASDNIIEYEKIKDNIKLVFYDYERSYLLDPGETRRALTWKIGKRKVKKNEKGKFCDFQDPETFQGYREALEKTGLFK